MKVLLAAFSVLIFCSSLTAENPPPTPAVAQVSQRLVSPEIHSDRSVTFRFAAPNAKDVRLVFEGAKPAPMTKDDSGIWTINVAPLDPDYYGYFFSSDGVATVDPANPSLKPNLITT